jgi:hypothetical protein
VSFAVTTVLGLLIGGWFGLILGAIVWLGLRLFMQVRPWPPRT